MKKSTFMKLSVGVLAVALFSGCVTGGGELPDKESVREFAEMSINDGAFETRLSTSKRPRSSSKGTLPRSTPWASNSQWSS